MSSKGPRRHCCPSRSHPSDTEPVSTTGLQSCPQGTGVIAHGKDPQAGLLTSQRVPVFHSVYPEHRHPSLSLKQTKFESYPAHLFTVSPLLPCWLGLFLQPFLVMTFLPADVEQISVSHAYPPCPNLLGTSNGHNRD